MRPDAENPRPRLAELHGKKGDGKMNVRDWPMARKFLVGTLAITLTAIAFVSVSLIVSERKMVQAARLGHTRALVGVIAENAAVALVFDDVLVARQILASASAEPSTNAAALYDENGDLYAWFPHSVARESLPARAGRPHARFSENHLDAFADITINGRKVGTAFLRADPARMRARLQRYMLTVIGTALAASALALILSKAMERWITRPLIQLTDTATFIAESGDYSLRAAKQSEDEIGTLVDAFNHMVREVETSQRKVEAHTANLEREVAERTAKLRETIGELEAFSYSVSHDMRTPLRAMRNYADILLEEHRERLNPEGVNYLNRISVNAGRLDLLVRDILIYSKVSKEELELQPVDLSAFLATLISQLPESQHAARITLLEPLPTVLVHDAYLSQVFSNLIGNAVKFTPEGTIPRIEISATDEGAYVKVFVRDNGIGIDPTHFERIFEIFGQVRSGKHHDGTGIGLSIVKKAVQRMGGQIGLESDIGKGTSFWFTLLKGTS